MELASHVVSQQTGVDVNLPVGKLLVQNIVLLFVPIAAGAAFRRIAPKAASRVNKVLGKAAFPALMLLALLFFLQYTKEIMENFALLGLATASLILAAMLCSSLLSRLSGFTPAVAGHCNRLFSFYLQQRRDGHSRHNLRTADEHSAACLCIRGTPQMQAGVSRLPHISDCAQNHVRCTVDT